MKKKGFTLEQHKDVGARLRRIRDELTHISTEIGNAYPLTKWRKLNGIVNRIDQLRSDMENKLYSEHHERQGDELTDIYYGTLSGNRHTKASKDQANKPWTEEELTETFARLVNKGIITCKQVNNRMLYSLTEYGKEVLDRENNSGPTLHILKEKEAPQCLP